MSLARKYTSQTVAMINSAELCYLMERKLHRSLVSYVPLWLLRSGRVHNDQQNEMNRRKNILTYSVNVSIDIFVDIFVIFL